MDARSNPSSTSDSARTQMLTSICPPVAERFPIENGMATPTMNRKNGKTRSVIVQPCQSACLSGPWTWPQLPGLFTSSIVAIVMPRKMSSDASRSAFTTIGSASTGGRASSSNGSGAIGNGLSVGVSVIMSPSPKRPGEPRPGRAPLYRTARGDAHARATPGYRSLWQARHVRGYDVRMYAVEIEQEEDGRWIAEVAELPG